MFMRIAIVIGVCILSTVPFVQAPAQEGLGEQIGEQLDRGLTELRGELRQGWAEIRQTVERMGVQGRVYSRLRWDKDLETSRMDIEMRDSNVVVLQGRVASAAAKQKAVQLARDTVGVEEVVDQLTVAADVD